jgi:hypothetical protein
MIVNGFSPSQIDALGTNIFNSQEQKPRIVLLRTIDNHAKDLDGSGFPYQGCHSDSSAVCDKGGLRKQNRKIFRIRVSVCYLSQHTEPSSGCAQQAPLFSSLVWLGVQQSDASLLGKQQEEVAGTTFFSGVLLIF